MARYGIACGDDISEVHNAYLFAVGASCSAALFYPNAPLRQSLSFWAAKTRDDRGTPGQFELPSLSR